MSPRAILTLILIVLAACAESIAMGTRFFITLDAHEAGGGYVSVAMIYSTTAWISLFAMFVGAAIAYAVGPRITAAGAALVSALGLAVVVALPKSLLLGWGVVAIGSGLFRVCPYAAAADVLGSEKDVSEMLRPSPRRFTAMAAFALGFHGLITLSSIFATPVFALIRAGGGEDKAGRIEVMAVAIAFMIIAAVFAGASEITSRLDARISAAADASPKDPYRAGTPETPEPLRNGATLSGFGSTGLQGLAVMAIAISFYDLVSTIGHQPPSSLYSSGAKSIGQVYAVSPVIMILVCAAASITFLIIAMKRLPRIPLFVFAVGLMIAGFGFMVTAGGESSLVIYVLGIAIATIGGATAAPIGVAYAALAVRGRAAPFAIAAWIAMSGIISLTMMPLFSIARDNARIAILLVFGLVTIVSGIIFLTKTRRIHMLFEERQ